jgi:Periplasmic copper-binding protein (NosD)
MLGASPSQSEDHVPAHIKIAAAAAMSCIVIGAPPAHAAGPGCGAVVAKSTTLQRNLTNCPGDGLVIGADNLTLDLGGHTIDGTAAPATAGIRLAGHHGVRVQRGSLQEFGNGVLLDAADGNALLRVTVRRSFGRGIQLQNGSHGNRLEFDVSSDNGSSGFGLIASDRNVVTHATGTGNAFSGLQGFGASGNRVVGGTFRDNKTGVGLNEGSNGNLVAGNVLSDNTEPAVGIDGNDNVITGNRSDHDGWGISFSGDRNRIVANVVSNTRGCSDGDCGSGIDNSGGANNLVALNVVTGAVDQGIRFLEFEADGGPPVIGNVIRGNIVRDAGSDGIELQSRINEVTGHGTLKDNLVAGNLVTGSGHDGINVGRPANTVSGNVTLRNDVLGIEAVPGVIDGGGNRAFGNGDPRQCVIVACH